MTRSQRALKPLKMPLLCKELLEAENIPPRYQAVDNRCYGLEYTKGVKIGQGIQKSIKERVEVARARYRRIQRNEPSYKVYPALQQQSVFHNAQYSEQPTYVEQSQGLITPVLEDAPVPHSYHYLPVQQHSVFHNTKYDSGNFQQYVEQEEAAPAPHSSSTNYMPMLTPSPEAVNLPVVTFAAPELGPVVNKADAYRRNRAKHQLQRYHAMTAEQKHQYNQKRIEQCRNRRTEDRLILSEAAKPNATPEILAKAEEVLARKKMYQERNERMKYNKMMDAKRKKENGTD